MSFVPIEPRAIRVHVRCQEDYLPTVTSDLVVQLKELAGCVNLVPLKLDPADNPLAITVELAHLSQVEPVKEIATRWVNQPLGPNEHMERILAILTPDKSLVGWAMVPEDELGGLSYRLDPADAEAAR